MATANGRNEAEEGRGILNVMENINKQEWDFFSTALIEEARTAIWQTRASIEPRELIDRVKGKLQEISTVKSGSDSEEAVWNKVREALVAAAYETRPYCLKCGACCKKDAPSLLIEDMELLKREIIRPEHLYTVRSGEVAYSPFQDKAIELAHEIIKVRSTGSANRCIFFRGLDGLCSIYESRPFQCRLQECWNPDRLAQMEVEYVTREHVFKHIQPLWNIISAHEERCSIEKWRRAMEHLESTKGHSVEEVLELLTYDHHVREFVAERFSVNSNVAELIFGRPLRASLPSYGLEIIEDPEGAFVLQPLRKTS